MKRVLLFAAAALMFFACSKNDNAPAVKNDGQAKKFYAVTEGTTVPGTKVYADEYLKLLWNAEDELSIFDENTANDRYMFDGKDGDNAGGFDLIEAGADGTDLNYVYSIYPYSADNAINSEGTQITTNLPADQAYREGNFGPGASTMTAVAVPDFANGTLLKFKNACGYLKFLFYGDDVKVKSVVLEGNNGEKIAGQAVISVALDQLPAVAMGTDATGIITLNCAEPVTLGTTASDATEFIFVIPPTTFTGGFKITVYGDEGGVFPKESTRSLVIARNKMESMKAMKVELSTKNRYELVKSNDYIADGDYVLAYHNGTAFNLFSFAKTMKNAEDAADAVKDVHGLSALLAKGSQIYSTVVGNNFVTVDGEAGADYITVPDDAAEAVLSVTGGPGGAKLTLASGEYSLRLDNVITEINSDYTAILSVQPNAPDALNIMYSLRGGKVTVTFNELIDFAIAEAKKEGVTFTDEQISRLRSGFEKLCRIAKEQVEAKLGKTLMDITLSTDVFEVIAQYYDNVADYSLQLSEEKKLGWATPVGFYAGDNGFTANIALPQAGWFDRIQASLHYQSGSKDDFVAYWATIDPNYNILDIENFFQRAARRFVNELDPSTYELLQQVDFSKIGSVYAKYANRFNDKLEKVYLYKKIAE